MDAFYASSSFSTLIWYWDEKSPFMHIYSSDMWENNFIPQDYELRDLFLGSMYFKIFKTNAPMFSEGARELISLYGEWYVGEYFSYIIIWGSNIFHLLPSIVPNRMVLQEFSYQTVIDGVFPKLSKHNKRAWPKFPISLDALVLQNPTHASLLGKEISIMNLGEASKRMHDPMAYLSNLFAHEKIKFHYVHESDPDDSMFR